VITKGPHQATGHHCRNTHVLSVTLLVKERVSVSAALRTWAEETVEGCLCRVKTDIDAPKKKKNKDVYLLCTEQREPLNQEMRR